MGFSGGGGASSSPVQSVFGRTGTIAAANGDYYGVVANALTGAIAASRYVGGTASGAPASGTFLVGDFVIDQTGGIYICTVAGTPGTWVKSGSSVSTVFGRTGAVVATNGDYYGVVASALTGATAASRYVGATASGAPVSGTFAAGDYVIDQTGKVYVCIAAGTPGTWVSQIADEWSIGIPIAIPSSNTNFSNVNLDSVGRVNYLNSSGAQNAFAEWKIPMSAGTWTIFATAYYGADRGIASFTIAGNAVGTIDWYNATSVGGSASLTGISVATSGTKAIRVTMATKNGSSTNFLGYITGLNLLRTA